MVIIFIALVILMMWGPSTGGPNGTWGDAADNPTFMIWGYLVEYPVPEPASLALFSMVSMGGLAAIKRRRLRTHQ